MTERLAPEELFRHGMRLLLDGDSDSWVALWDDDGVIEFPFAPEGAPGRLDGRTAIAAYMQGLSRHIDLHATPHLEIHHTREPDTIVVEMRAVGRQVVTDEPFTMSYIVVVTAREGRFTHWRDYWNPLGLPASWAAEHEDAA